MAVSVCGWMGDSLKLLLLALWLGKRRVGEAITVQHVEVGCKRGRVQCGYHQACVPILATLFD